MPSAAPEQSLDENGSYTSRDDVALYIHSYGHLPPNFVTKDEARAALDALAEYAPKTTEKGRTYLAKAAQLRAALVA